MSNAVQPEIKATCFSSSNCLGKPAAFLYGTGITKQLNNRHNKLKQNLYEQFTEFFHWEEVADGIVRTFPDDVSANSPCGEFAFTGA
jgi:hypothetical protein